MLKWGPYVPVCGEVDEMKSPITSEEQVIGKRVVTSILRILRAMLKTGKEKRYFVSHEVIRSSLVSKEFLKI
jgi:hypothetical protein